MFRITLKEARHWDGNQRVLLAIPLLLFTVTSQPMHGQRSPDVRQHRGGVGSVGTTMFRGQELSFEVVDGLAIHGGDMILGPVEQVVAEYERRRALKKHSRDARDVGFLPDTDLWPDGVIPYVIDSGFTEGAMGNIHAAINAWNSRTVITLVERTTEPDFVRFVPEGGRYFCAAYLGRRGGEQKIILGDADGCPVWPTAHEIGHAVGLMHEHQRKDRDHYISVPDGALRLSSYIASSVPSGPYDYASVMHYRNAITIPPGMLLGPAVGGEPPTAYGNLPGLSSGDIDGVARLYGKPPAMTTISTNPPGLEMIVDGERVLTPARFHWSPGSKHVLEAPSPQAVGQNRLVFGRWNYEATGSSLTVTADPGATWFEANYIVLNRVIACADPLGAGNVTIRPESGDGFYVGDTPVEIEANPASGSSHEFLEWSRRDMWVRGKSTNPFLPGISPDLWDVPTARAVFSPKSLFRIDSNVDGTRIYLNGGPIHIPWAFPADRYPNGVAVEAPEIYDLGDVRHRFNSWSDGGGRVHHVAVPASGGGVRLNRTPEYRLRTSAGFGNENMIQVSPESEDGFYADSTQVMVTAVPSAEVNFAGWIGARSGPARVQTVVMDAPKFLQAVFTQSEPVRPGETKNVVLEATDQFRLYSGRDGYTVVVPPDASELAVSFQSSSEAEVDLYVRRGREPWVDYGESPRVYADFESTSPGANEKIIVSRGSTPPLENNSYHIGLAVQPAQGRIRGTLSVDVRRSGIVTARPRAFTFLSHGGSDPVSQPIRLTHHTTGSIRYRIDSNQSWLTVSPQEWVQAGPGTTKIAVTVNSGGQAHGTHRSKLIVVQTGGEGSPEGWTPTGIEIPVVFAVAPVLINDSPRVSNVLFESRPHDGKAYVAGEVIEVLVQFSVPVEVDRTGIPALELTVGSRTRQAVFDRWIFSNHCGGYQALRFRYRVQVEDSDADGISIAADALTPKGGSIRNAAGANAVLDLGSHAIVNDEDHKVEGRGFRDEDSETNSDIFVPVILSSSGLNKAFFTSEMTLTNRGSEPANLRYTYTAHKGGGSGTASASLAPGRQQIVPNAIDYLRSLGIPIPAAGNRIGTLRVEVSESSDVGVTVRTTTTVPDGRAGLAYPGIATAIGIEEAFYLCGLRQNAQDRSNLAVQNAGDSSDGNITLRVTVFSGESAATGSSVVLPDLSLAPGGFHQYNGILNMADFDNGYVKVDRVEGTAPYYAYGVINDNFNSDGSFVFPVREDSLAGKMGQTLPVIIETASFQSELTVTNFSASDKTIDFNFVADAVGTTDERATFSLKLKAGEQRILPDIVEYLRGRETAGIGPAGRAFVGALFATVSEGDMSGIVIGARTGSPDQRGGQYSLFYNGVPYGSASIESAWIYGLQQNEENRSNLALVNTGEIDDSSSTFEIDIYDGSGDPQLRTKSVTIGAQRWYQINGILGNRRQGYIEVRKTSGRNPFVTYGVVNDGGAPGERSGDGAFLPSQ